MSIRLEPLIRGWRGHLLLSLYCALIFLPGLSSVPPLDRDESRYVQASRQMLESGDFVRIRFQDAPRHKKPVAVHWLQSLSVSLLQAEPYDDITAYRLVSALSAWGAVLLSLALGRRLLGVTESGLERSASVSAPAHIDSPPPGPDTLAFIASALLAGSFALLSEAHQAKTDALLCLWVVMMQLGLARIAFTTGRSGFPWLFWLGLGLGTLTKGPVAPAIAVLTIGTLMIGQRSAALLGKLCPLRGLLLAAAVVAPWSVAIYLATDGQFFSQAASEDFLPKLVSGHESHGAPPGYYVLTALLMFWPGSMLAIPALAWAVQALRARRADRPTPSMPASTMNEQMRLRQAILFALSWLAPTWLLLELVPTKLPHYTLPLYPALALLTAIGVGLAQQRVRAGATLPAGRTGRMLLWTHTLLWSVPSLALAALVLLLPRLLELQAWPGAVLLAMLVTAATVTASLAIVRRRLVAALLIGIIAAPPFAIALTADYVPRLQPLWISQHLARIVRRIDPQRQAVISISGYHEPSVVFALGTASRLTDRAGVERGLHGPGPAIGIIAEQIETLPEQLPRTGPLDEDPSLRLVEVFSGFNYSKGKPLRISVYSHGLDASPEPPPAAARGR